MRRLRVSRPEVRARACSEQLQSGFTLGSASEYTNPGKTLVDRQPAGQIAKLFNAVLQAPLLQGIDQRFTSAWVPEIHRADLDGGCAGQHELNHIFRGTDTADSNDWYLHRFRSFPHHARGNRLDGGSRQSSGDVGDARLARL